MDREHPIPQEVSTYEFRLVGDMTIKQFMQVAAGALISLVIYSSGMAPYVKWPLIIISFLSGIALAFFPIEDRPLSKWIVLFVKAIYSPTVYVWDKNARRYEFFQPEPLDITATDTLPIPASPGFTPPLATDQGSAAMPGSDIKELGNLEKKEQEFLNKVSSEFNSAQPLTTPANVTLEPLKATKEERKVVVPKQESVQVETQPKPVVPQPRPQEDVYNAGGNVTPMAGQQMTDVKAATFSQEASPPTPPTRPNVIVGQVLTSDGKIIDSAILEIKDSEGRPVRALRSNRLGHFMIVTPLSNGTYNISTEKEGYSFDPVTFDANDQIIPPIAIWAKMKD